MNRRDSIKYITWSTLSTSLILDACKNKDKLKIEEEVKVSNSPAIDRMPEEKAIEDKLMSEKFFTDHELATIAILSDIIIPKDDVSGSATDAKVPDFIEFIVKDKPELQLPMRGGLRWLDMQMMKLHNKPFKDVSQEQRIAIIDQIAYPKKAKTEMMQGVRFFDLMRDLTASGFYTSEIGIKDIGYVGNRPNQWNGVPDDVLKQYGLAYTDKELKECISFT
ncbi:MAG: gluconate 2-dehydrogenase subunit 3 family protein [Flavisolibacter sp.]